DLLQELQADLGIAYLFISHDMAVIERVSHRVAVMYVGQIGEMGSRAQVFEDPRHPYTRRLLAAVPVPDPTQRRDFSATPMDETAASTRSTSPVVLPDVGDGHLVAGVS